MDNYFTKFLAKCHLNFTKFLDSNPKTFIFFEFLELIPTIL